jgi:hypothetical protein
MLGGLSLLLGEARQWTTQWTFLQEEKDQVEFGNDLDEVTEASIHYHETSVTKSKTLPLPLTLAARRYAHHVFEREAIQDDAYFNSNAN